MPSCILRLSSGLTSASNISTKQFWTSSGANGALGRLASSWCRDSCQDNVFIALPNTSKLNRKKFISKIEWIYDYSWEVINAFSVVLLGLVKIFFTQFGTWAYWLLAVSLALYVPSIIKIIKNKTRSSKQEEIIESLSKEKEEYEKSILNYQEGFENFLKSYLAIIFSKLELTDDDRISIYFHQSDHFSLLCRYSSNPAITKKGRPTYPDNQGFVAKGFQESFLHINNLPNPNSNEDKYIAEVKKLCKIDESALRSLSMKSRSYSVFAIEHPITTNRVAVIVFESKRYDFDKCDEIVKLLPELGKQVVSYIYYSENIRPELSFAKQKGL